MTDIDGEYYLAIQGLNNCFYNLFISTQDVKIMALEKGFLLDILVKKDDFLF